MDGRATEWNGGRRFQHGRLLAKRRRIASRGVERTLCSLQSLIRIVDGAGKQLHGNMEMLEAKADAIVEQVGGVIATVREIAVDMGETSENVQLLAGRMAQVDSLLQGVQASTKSWCVRPAASQSGILRHGMDELGEALTRIAGIVRLIDDIFGKTQLLALNANIEAARAGEHGKGFPIRSHQRIV